MTSRLIFCKMLDHGWERIGRKDWTCVCRCLHPLALTSFQGCCYKCIQDIHCCNSNRFITSIQHCWGMILFLVPETASYQSPFFYSSSVTAPWSFCWTEYTLPADNLIYQLPLQFHGLQLWPIGCERKSECNISGLPEGRVDVCPFSFWLTMTEVWWPPENHERQAEYWRWQYESMNRFLLELTKE